MKISGCMCRFGSAVLRLPMAGFLSLFLAGLVFDGLNSEAEAQSGPRFSSSSDIYLYFSDNTEISTTLAEAIGGRAPLLYEFEHGRTSGGVTTNTDTGLVFTQATRVLSGRTLLQGVYRVPYFVTDANGNFTSIDYVVTICTTGGSISGRGFCSAPTFVTPGFLSPVVDHVYSLNTPVSETLPRPFGGTGTTSGRIYVSLQGQRPLRDRDAPTLSGGRERNGEILYSSTDYALPEGLTYTNSARRTFSGTPTATGSVNLRYSAIDQASGEASRFPFTLTVVDGPSFHPSAQVAAQEYDAGTDIGTVSLGEASSAGSETFTYSLTGPDRAALDTTVPGLSFDADTRALSGTPTAAGTFVLTYTATQASSSPVTQTFTVTVTGLEITALDDQSYEAGSQISALLLPAGSGGIGTPTYTLEGPDEAALGTALPGLVFDPATRVLSGTPTTTGTTVLTYTARQDDPSLATRTFTVTVTGPVLTAGAPYGFVAGTPSSFTLAAATGVGNIPAVTYTLTGPDEAALSELPVLAGLSFDPRGRILSGTPTTAGFALLTYTATDKNGNTGTAVLFVFVSGPFFDAVATQVYMSGVEGTVTLPDVNPAGGTTGLTFSLESSAGEDVGTALPGLSFDADTRVLSGTPTTTGLTEMVYSVADDNVVDEDDNTNTYSQNFFVSVTVGLTLGAVAEQTFEAGNVITSITLPAASQSAGTLTYSLTGLNEEGLEEDLSELPALADLSFDPATRVLSGTPTTAGTTVLTYTATDTVTNPDDPGATSVMTSVMSVFTVIVTGPILMEVADQTYSVGTPAMTGTPAAELTLPAATGVGNLLAVTYSLTGPNGEDLDELLPGLGFNPQSRILSGTPTASGVALLTYTATDANDNTGMTTFFVEVTGVILATATDRAYTVGTPTTTGTAAANSLAFPAATGVLDTEQVSYELSGEVPGMVYNQGDRTLAGTPTQAGTYVLTHTATDNRYGSTGSQTYTVVVTGWTLGAGHGDFINPLIGADVVSSALPAATGTGTNVTLTYTLTGPGGAALSTVVPDLVFDPVARTFAGTLTAVTRLPSGAPGIVVLTYVAADNYGNSIVQTFPVRVSSNVVIAEFAAGSHTYPIGVPIGTDTFFADMPEELVGIRLPAATGGDNPVLTYRIEDRTGRRMSANQPEAGRTTFAVVPGLILFGDRILSGTPTQAGTYALTYIAEDNFGNPASRAFTLIVTEGLSFVGGATQANVAENIGTPITAITLPEAATVGSQTYLYTLTDAEGLNVDDTENAVPGLVFAPGTRILTGDPTRAGAFTLTYTATDESDSENTATLTFIMTVRSGPTLAVVADIPVTIGTPAVDTTLPEGDGGIVEPVADHTYTLTDAEGLNVDATDNAVPGLVFDPTTRILSGDVTRTGAYTLTYTFTDAGENSVTTAVSVTVTGGPTLIALTAISVNAGTAITTTELPAAAGGLADPVADHTYTLTDAEGVNVDATDNAVPGLTFTPADRMLTGAPTQTGTYALTYTFTDGGGNTAVRGLDVTVAGGPTLAAVGDRTFTVGLSESGVGVSLGPATGGFAPLVYAVETSDGVALSDHTQENRPTSVIPGIGFQSDPTNAIAPLALVGIPQAIGTHVLIYSVTDAGGNTAAQTFTLTVTGPTLAAVADITDAVTGTAITATTLPEAVGQGTDGDFATATFIYTVTDSAGEAVDTAAPGLVFNSDRATRELSGTPTRAGVFILTYTATDRGGNAVTQTFTVTVAGPTLAAVTDPAAYPVASTTITPFALPAATGFSGTLTHTVVDYAGVALATAVPGLALDETNTPPEITGTPTQIGTFPLIYTVTDGVDTRQRFFTLTVSGPMFTRVKATGDDLSLTVGTAIPTAGVPSGGFSAAAAGAIATTTFTLQDAEGLDVDATATDNAIPGLTFTDTTRVLTGTPETAGTYVLTYTLTDGNADTSVQTFTVTVAGGPTFASGASISNRSFAAGGAFNEAAYPAVESSGPFGAVTYALADAEGVVVDATGTAASAIPGVGFALATRILSGTPTTTGTHVLTYTATDEGGNAVTLTPTVLILGPELTTTVELIDREFAVGAAITAVTLDVATVNDVTGLGLAPVALTGSTAANYTLQDFAGLDVDGTAASAVPGLSFDGAVSGTTPAPRILSGTPTTLGTYPLVYGVTDGDGNGGTVTFTVFVTGPILAAEADAVYTAGETVSRTLAEAPTSSGTLAYALTGPEEVTVGSVLPGLSFAADTRILSGTPTSTSTAAEVVALTYTATDTATDGTISTGTQVFTVRVNPALEFVPGSVADQTYTTDATVTSPLILPRARGGTGALAYTLVGAADAVTTDLLGLTFDATTRAFGSGAGNAATITGTYTLTYTVTDANTVSTSLMFEVVVEGTLAFLPGQQPSDQTYVRDVAIPTITLPAPLSRASDVLSYTLQDSTGLDVDTTDNAVPGLTFSPIEVAATTTDALIPARTLAGTPTATGEYVLTYTVTDSRASDANSPGTVIFTVTVVDTPVLRQMSQADRSYFTGEDVTLILPAGDSLPTDDGTNRLTYSLTDADGNNAATDNVIPGLVFFPASRALRGRPTTPAGETELTYTVTDAEGSSIATLTFGITVVGPSFVTAFESDLVSNVGTAITDRTLSDVVTRGGGTRTVSLTDADGTPLAEAVPGLVFDLATRVLSGTPTVVGTTELLYTVSDVYGNTDIQTFAARIEGSAFVDTVDDQSYLAGVSTSPLVLPEVLPATGTQVYVLQDSAGLDVDATDNAVPGMIFTPATRVLTGTPTSVGTYTLTYSVSGGTLTGTPTSPTFSVVVAGVPIVFADTVPDQTVDRGAELSLQLPAATGGVGTLTYTLVDAAAADLGAAAVNGLTFSSAGENSRFLSGRVMASALLTYTASEASSGNMARLVFVVALVSEGFDETVDEDVLVFVQPDLADPRFVGVRLPGQPGRVGEIAHAAAMELPRASEDILRVGGAGTRTLTYTTLGDAPVGIGYATLISAANPPTIVGRPETLPAGVDERSWLLGYTATDGSDDTFLAELSFSITAVRGFKFEAAVLGDVQDLYTYHVGQEIDSIELPRVEDKGRIGSVAYSLGPGLPPGLYFDPSTSRVMGTPQLNLGSYSLTYRAIDQGPVEEVGLTLTFAIDIVAPPPYFAAPVADQTYAVGALVTEAEAVDLPAALPTAGLPTVDMDGVDTTTDIAYIYTLDPVPDGLTFRSLRSNDGTTSSLASRLYGTPTTAGTYTLTYTATRPDTLASATLNFRVVVRAGPAFRVARLDNLGYGLNVQIANRILPTALGGVTYSLTDSAGTAVGAATGNPVPGLSFSPVEDVVEVEVAPTATATATTTTTTTFLARTLAGTPSETGSTELTYTVADDTVTEAAPCMDDDIRCDMRRFSVTVVDDPDLNNASPSFLGRRALVAGNIPTTFEGEPGTSMTVDLERYFEDDDPLVYTARLDDSSDTTAASSVPGVSVDGSILTVHLGLREHDGSDTTRVFIVATDPFGRVSTLDTVGDVVGDLALFVRVRRAPTLALAFVDVELEACTPATYSELTGNGLADHFSNSSGGGGLTGPYRYNVVSSDSMVVHPELADTGLVEGGATTLTLNPGASVGEAVTVTVSLFDTSDEMVEEQTFMASVIENADNPDANCIVGQAGEADTAAAGEINRVILPEVARAIAGHIVDAITRRLEDVRKGVSAASGSIGGQTSIAATLAAHGEAVSDDTRSLEDLLGRSSFTLPLGAGAEGVSTSSVTIWGGGDYRDLSGEGEGVDWEGDLLSIHLGADTQLRNNVTVGLAVSRSRSDVDFKRTAPDGTPQEGTHDLTVTNVSPYVGWSTERLDLWGSVSLGSGEVEINGVSSQQESSDIEMRTIAAGVSGKVRETEGGSIVRIKGDVLQSEIEVDANGAGIPADKLDVNRLRVAVEASRPRTLESGARLEPSLEAGIRHDGGDGNTGSGLELNAGVSHSSPTNRVTLEGGVYTLLGRDNYEEWGVHGQVRLAVGKAGRGLSLRLSPGYGNSQSGLQNIWQQDVIELDESPADASMRVDTRIGYGLSSLAGQGLLTPYSEVTFNNTNTYRLGVQWDAGPALDLNLAGERSGTSGVHKILLKGEIRF